jgi:hypothetical protein
LPGPEAYAYTDGASTGSRGPGAYGVVIRWEGKTKEIRGGELNTTNLRMELTAACVALETLGPSKSVGALVHQPVHQLWRTPVVGSLLVVEGVVGHPELQTDA